ncbi:preprotein translocase subunit SecE [Candidatus Micrarchaeota archaeon]|nr:preprotein translocase subunit SecE [Candidatus Micrarchaeota archaeon]
MDILKFISRVRMIIHKTTKPKDAVFWRTAKVTFIGMVLIGTLGLLIYGLFLGINILLKFITG